MRLTPRQQEAFNFIAAYLRATGRAPSYREIADALGVASLHAVEKHLAHLEARGLLRRAERQSSWRAWELTGQVSP